MKICLIFGMNQSHLKVWVFVCCSHKKLFLYTSIHHCSTCVMQKLEISSDISCSYIPFVLAKDSQAHHPVQVD